MTPELIGLAGTLVLLLLILLNVSVGLSLLLVGFVGISLITNSQLYRFFYVRFTKFCNFTATITFNIN